MADNSITTQGTELFISINGTAVLKFDCPTAVNGLGFSASEIPLDCLDAVNETTRPGRKKINPFTVPFILQEGSAAHEYMLELVNNPVAEIPYCIGLANGTDDPTLTSGAFVAPGGATPTRTVVMGKGYVKDVSLEVGANEVVRGQFTFTPTSQTYTFKA